MAFIEDDLDLVAATEQQLDDIGEEVEIFAKFLDESIIARGSAPEQRARIFKLVDHYYEYSRETADVMRERLRLARLARGSSGDSTSSSNVGGTNNNSNNKALAGRRPGLRSGGAMDVDAGSQTALQRQDDAAASENDTAASAQRWEEEAQTWDLLRRLLPLRYREKVAPTAAAAASAAANPIRRGVAAAAADRPPQSRREYWADFVLSEPKARERKTILEWLQSSANSSAPDIDEVVQELQRNAERGEILAHGWLHTRGAIKQHKRLVATSEPLDPNSPDVRDSNLDAPNRLVTQLDPDVVTRQGLVGRKLAPQDAFFEQAIWLGCYELLRRGKSMADIRDWCVERTEVWRAASISALPLANDDSGGDGNGSSDDDEPDFDCLATVLWRRMCYRLSQEGSASLHERAVYGILSGDLASVEAVSTSWDDLAFAKYNAELRAQFDAYLIRQADAAAVHSLLILHGDVPVGYSSSDSSFTSPSSSFVPSAHLSSHISSSAPSSFLRDRDSRTRKVATAKTPAKALQAAMIDEKLDSFLFQQGVLLAEYANTARPSKLIPKYDSTTTASAAAAAAAAAAASDTKFVEPTDCHGLRILAHVLIVVSALDKLDGKGKDIAALGPLARRHQTEEHAIAGYISFLRLARLEELIPLYASKLLGERCYTNMALNLIHIEERDVQQRLLQLMRKLGLDPVKFVKTLPQLFLADVADAEEARRQGSLDGKPPCTSFTMLQSSAPTLKFGRLIKPGIFGTASELAGDADGVLLVDKADELLIRSIEWMMLVDGLALETCDFGVRIYKYFLRNEHLTAARVLASRVSCAEIVRNKTRFGRDLSEDTEPSWWDDVFGVPLHTSPLDVDGDNMMMMDDDTFGAQNGNGNGNGFSTEVSKNQVAAHARPLYELECLVNALDCLETTSLLAHTMINENADPVRDRNIAGSIDDNAKFIAGFMKPLLKDWLLHSVDDDPDYAVLRESYLPQVVIGYASTLQFAGTTSSRDYLLECMELAAVVAAPDSDVAGVLVATGRMKELVESFASCSKALAIWTSDMKKGPGASSKKNREMGWSRELWSVKP
ncbi:Nucleoporin nup84 [Sporothrix curviconia]|uniref:Nuclear pore complex protein n=1 Tax=Sporothrix curviconia TaxID=1260050 RepID=A0ABP0AQZ5_9PEZI